MLYQIRVPAWLSGLFVLAFGYTTGLQLGKVSPFVARLEADLGLGLTFAGWLTSLLALFVALAAAAAGRLVARLGALPALKAGALIMVAGGLLFGSVVGPGLLLAARAVEAVGYVLAVVAAPAYLATAVRGRLRPALLALWGSVVPVGFAMANLLAGGLRESGHLSDAFLIFALPLAATALPVLVLSGASAEMQPPKPARGAASEGKVAWLPVLGFGFYVYLSIGFLTFLPTFAEARPEGGLPPGLVPLLVPLGSFAVAAGLARLGGRTGLRLALLGFLCLACAAPFVFSGNGGPAMAVYAVACGVSAASLFASVPLLAPTPGSASRTLGALAQAGGTAALLGPPLAGSIIESFGWPVLAGSFVAVALLVAAAIAVHAGVRWHHLSPASGRVPRGAWWETEPRDGESSGP